MCGTAGGGVNGEDAGRGATPNPTLLRAVVILLLPVLFTLVLSCSPARHADGVVPTLTGTCRIGEVRPSFRTPTTAVALLTPLASAVLALLETLSVLVWSPVCADAMLRRIALSAVTHVV